MYIIDSVDAFYYSTLAMWADDTEVRNSWADDLYSVLIAIDKDSFFFGLYFMNG